MGAISKLFKAGTKVAKKSNKAKSKLIKTVKQDLKNKTAKKMLNRVKGAAAIGAAGNIGLGVYAYNKNKNNTPVAKQVLNRAKTASKKK
jgi:hypothetical protein